MTIQCEIVTQERSIFSGEVDAINVPGVEGRMGILPKHTALLTTLKYGEVMVRTNGEEHFYAIGGGIIEVQPDKVVILADSAEHADEIDLARAKAAREAAEKVMAEGVPEDPDQYAQIQASLLRAQVRLNVGQRRRRSALATGSYEDQE